ncbi:MAG: ATP-binding cassette domain-containing protein [Treponema sp.]|jgi:ABC-type glutathione transport system ATPase component|nr:ATP-binding cassette domain-containing protein [Treponema sp.]
MPYIIELQDVHFSAQTRNLVHDISIGFDEGKTTALVGPSGGGKSTVLKLAAGLFPPDKGEVLFREREIIRMGRQENLAFRKEASFVFQDSALWANQNLMQILELPLRLHFPSMTKAEQEKRIKSVVAEVGYRKNLMVRPSELSMGEQKLIAFARAMMCSPQLLFLDEWTESLDQSAMMRLVGIVKRLREKGTSIILVSHNIGVIRDLADFVVVIAAGQISHRLTREQIESNEDLSRFIEQEIAS